MRKPADLNDLIPILLDRAFALLPRHSDRSPQGPVQTLTHINPQGLFLLEVQNDRQR
jgi:hypothetical protein